MLKQIQKNDLDNFINKYQIKRGVEATNVCQTAQNVLRKVFCIEDDSIIVSSFKNGILNVRAVNSSLLQELKFRENQIIDLILDKIPDINLNKIIGKIK